MHFLDVHVQERRKTITNMARKVSVSSDSPELPLAVSIDSEFSQEGEEMVIEGPTEELPSPKPTKVRRMNLTPSSSPKSANMANNDVDNKILETLAAMANKKIHIGRKVWAINCSGIRRN
ncbi:uncharacterized protein [Onthophagus taurus]|uniref:uncharacterized protein n=1 Tax=Onthophagus taurus TaxID=166361 RepID=UPI0039BEA3C8